MSAAADQLFVHPEWIDAELAERSLAEFARQAWHVVEPGGGITDEFGRSWPLWNWHLDATCNALEAVMRGDIRNLLITVPPRSMKSLLVSVMWPAWSWLHRPEARWVFASYAQSLATRDSLKCRRIIESRWFREFWGDRFELTSDQNQKTRFENDATGYRIATSVGGSATGEGGDIVVVDDPHNVKEGESDPIREGVILWWDEVMSTRLDDPRTGAKVVVMQRIHYNDLAGHLIERGNYDHLCLPMEMEPESRCSLPSIDFHDPRTQAGELLWEERFDQASVDALRLDLGEYAFAGQMQQRPSPRLGGLFKTDHFEVVDALPAEVAEAIRAWDKAGTEGGGAFTAGVKMARLVDGRFAVLDVVRGQWSALNREHHIVRTATRDGIDVGIWVEQEPGSGGKESAEATVRALAGFSVVAKTVTGDKVTRADPYARQVEGGNVLLLRGQWTDEFIREHQRFPMSKFKDQVDAAAAAFSQLVGVDTAAARWLGVAA